MNRLTEIERDLLLRTITKRVTELGTDIVHVNNAIHDIDGRIEYMRNAKAKYPYLTRERGQLVARKGALRAEQNRLLEIVRKLTA